MGKWFGLLCAKAKRFALPDVDERRFGALGVTGRHYLVDTLPDVDGRQFGVQGIVDRVMAYGAVLASLLCLVFMGGCAGTASGAPGSAESTSDSSVYILVQGGSSTVTDADGASMDGNLDVGGPQAESDGSSTAGVSGADGTAGSGGVPALVPYGQPGATDYHPGSGGGAVPRETYVDRTLMDLAEWGEGPSAAYITVIQDYENEIKEYPFLTDGTYVGGRLESTSGGGSAAASKDGYAAPQTNVSAASSAGSAAASVGGSAGGSAGGSLVAQTVHDDKRGQLAFWDLDKDGVYEFIFLGSGEKDVIHVYTYTEGVGTAELETIDLPPNGGFAVVATSGGRLNVLTDPDALQDEIGQSAKVLFYRPPYDGASTGGQDAAPSGAGSTLGSGSNDNTAVSQNGHATQWPDLATTKAAVPFDVAAGYLIRGVLGR
ncbi:MAG: hypothetical protein LBR77_10905 [Lachnospiraceae bacterium]|jgi:hypothetical protein|nr:hypothetical protein [Lachnospiraceae bacterium]